MVMWLILMGHVAHFWPFSREDGAGARSRADLGAIDLIAPLDTTEIVPVSKQSADKPPEAEPKGGVLTSEGSKSPMRAESGSRRLKRADKRRR